MLLLFAKVSAVSLCRAS